MRHPPHYHRGHVIAIGSFLHGSGRSTVARALLQDVDGAIRLSTGDIFRSIALEEGFDDINAFVDYLSSHPKVMVHVETRIDGEVWRRLRELVREGKTVIIDSNLHVHPQVLRDVPSTHFYVYAPPEVIARRLMEGQRRGERTYGSEKEALEAQVTRTRKDADRYALLKKVAPSHLRPLYHHGERVIRRLLRSYIKAGKDPEKLKLALARITRGEGIFIDNGGSLTRTLSQVKLHLQRKGILTT